jgi:hypothetical protein
MIANIFLNTRLTIRLFCLINASAVLYSATDAPKPSHAMRIPVLTRLIDFGKNPVAKLNFDESLAHFIFA